jgi:hypothetical protein
MAEAAELVEIRTTPANDWTWIVVGSVMSAVAGFALATSSADDWQNVQGIRGEWLYAFLLRLVGVTGMRIFVVGFALLFGLNALAAAWRRKDDGLALRADEHGLAFHPSFCAAPLNWSDVESVEIGGRLPARITIRLNKRFWSLTRPFTGRDVQLNIVAIGSSYRAAEAKVRKMRRWLRR